MFHTFSHGPGYLCGASYAFTFSIKKKNIGQPQSFMQKDCAWSDVCHFFPFFIFWKSVRMARPSATSSIIISGNRWCGKHRNLQWITLECEILLHIMVCCQRILLNVGLFHVITVARLSPTAWLSWFVAKGFFVPSQSSVCIVLHIMFFLERFNWISDYFIVSYHHSRISKLTACHGLLQRDFSELQTVSCHHSLPSELWLLVCAGTASWRLCRQQEGETRGNWRQLLWSDCPGNASFYHRVQFWSACCRLHWRIL